MNHMNNSKSKRKTLQKVIWCKVRYWQQLNDVTDSELANYLEVAERTLKEYDKNSNNITLAKIDQFLYINNMTIHDLFNL